MKRSPQQTLVTMMVVLGGIWAAFWIYGDQRERRLAELPSELPIYEYQNLSDEELYAKPQFQRHANAPKTWADISLRSYAEKDGTWVKFLRCTIDQDEVERTNPDAFRDDVSRWREVDEQPPAWWPGQKADASEAAAIGGDTADATAANWAVPSWWAPSTDGIGTWWARPAQDTVVGLYLHYDPATRLMHVWEWRRQQADVTSPIDMTAEPVADLIASALAHDLAKDGHPVNWGDWLHSPDFPLYKARRYLPDLPQSVTRIDALLRPLKDMRYLLALHGISQAEAEVILGGVAVRPSPADSPPPVTEWAQALPQEDGEGVLPRWFAPGDGPRWEYALQRPGSGRVDAGRWAGYDAAKQILYIWDWRNP